MHPGTGPGRENRIVGGDFLCRMISPILPPPTAYSWRDGRSSPSPAWRTWSASTTSASCCGESLHIGKLSLDGGELHVDGRIDALTYEDAPETRGGGLFSRLFG